MDIRNYIINNFKESNEEEIKESIEASIKENDEITLPGLGVFFEIVWKSNNDIKKTIIDILKKELCEKK